MNLKPVLDAAKAADAEVMQIMASMTAAFGEGTEEGTQKALALRPTLDEAKAKADEANLLYVSMRDASGTPETGGRAQARKFVPAGADNPAADGGAKEMTRAAFAALEASAQMKFIKAGGKLVEPAEKE